MQSREKQGSIIIISQEEMEKLGTATKCEGGNVIQRK